jgi:pilus assembly protein Flp/PilA
MGPASRVPQSATTTGVNQMFASFLIEWVKQNWKREEGQTMAEYGLILALIAVVVIGTLTLIGTGIKTKLTDVVTGLK